MRRKTDRVFYRLVVMLMVAQLVVSALVAKFCTKVAGLMDRAEQIKECSQLSKDNS